MLKSILTPALIALTLAGSGAAFAAQPTSDAQLAASAGVAAGQYTAAELQAIIDARRDNDTSALNFPVSSWTTFNTAVRKSFDDGALAGGSIRVGVNNIADKDPPLANQLFGYFTSLYSARGRFWYLEMTKSF